MDKFDYMYYVHIYLYINITISINESDDFIYMFIYSYNISRNFFFLTSFKKWLGCPVHYMGTYEIFFLYFRTIHCSTIVLAKKNCVYFFFLIAFQRCMEIAVKSWAATATLTMASENSNGEEEKVAIRWLMYMNAELFRRTFPPPSPKKNDFIHL